jgi:selenocysteine lyase/cysteine desulfurase
VRLYTPAPDESFAPVLCFNIGSMGSTEAAAALSETGIATRAGLHCAPAAHKRLGTLEQGAVRICPSAFTSPAHIDRLLAAVSKISRTADDIFY